MDRTDDQERVDEISEELSALERHLTEVLHKLAEARATYFRGGRREEDHQAMEALENEVERLDSQLAALGDELQRISNIPSEVFETIEAEATKGDEVDRMWRDSLVNGEIEPSQWIEDRLPNALEILLQAVDHTWLQQERKNPYRLNRSFLEEPLSITRGIRAASEAMPIHRFAQALLVCEDFLARHKQYDFFAGALLVPQTAALGTQLPLLRDVSGDVDDRISLLWRGNGSSADATVFELLVAAACTARGRSIEALPPSSDKTPDFRVHDLIAPTVIECKRQSSLSLYEAREERHVTSIFRSLHDAARRLGMWGTYTLELDVEACDADGATIAEAGARQRFTVDPSVPTQYDWGAAAYRELPSRLTCRTTLLYSPEFLNEVFGWDSDVPQWDGIVCKVKTPDEILVNQVQEPLALLWRNNSEQAVKKRSWTPVSLFGVAAQQVPGGEVGLIYVCYQEGTREEIADRRTQHIISQMNAWWHEPSIRLPIAFLDRLYPRPLLEGRPDLIESCLRLKSRVYGSTAYFADFPGAVFTNL